jgi:hypothetical protein
VRRRCSRGSPIRTRSSPPRRSSERWSFSLEWRGRFAASRRGGYESALILSEAGLRAWSRIPPAGRTCVPTYLIPRASPVDRCRTRSRDVGTAFRIFVLMAVAAAEERTASTPSTSRRGRYTPEGIAWIAGQHMSTVQARHYPTLAPPLAPGEQRLRPWI